MWWRIEIMMRFAVLLVFAACPAPTPETPVETDGVGETDTPQDTPQDTDADNDTDAPEVSQDTDV
jgi:hypothetical protein